MADAEKRCPTCTRLLDPLRAPVARISGGRVVSYCSAECAAGRPVTPPPLPPPPSEAEVAALPEAPPIARATVAQVTDITPPPHEPEAASPPAVAAPEVPRQGPPASRGRWLGLAAIAAVATLAVVLLRLSDRAAVPPPSAVFVTVPQPRAIPAPVPLRTPTQLLADARASLGRSLADGSPRVRRLAALALSRAHDEGALAELRRAVAEDESEIRRLEAAYGLARAGDTSGADYLATGLRSSRRDVRLESARALARLGDQRGRDRLREAFSVNQLRLGAAEHLAGLGDETARRALHDALVGKNAEARMRAAVSLGRIGDPEATAALKEIVGTARVEVGAADALARLGDRDVAPTLARSLGSSALRVEASISLRRLGVSPDLGPLARALETEDDLGRISAGEALLVLLLPDPPAELK